WSTGSTSPRRRSRPAGSSDTPPSTRRSTATRRCPASWTTSPRCATSPPATPAAPRRTAPRPPPGSRASPPRRPAPCRAPPAAAPPPVCLDEPTAGMDRAQGADMRRLIRELGALHAVFVSSHALADVETLCDRVIVLHHARVLAEGAPCSLAARLRPAGFVDLDAVAPADRLALARATV